MNIYGTNVHSLAQLNYEVERMSATPVVEYVMPYEGLRESAKAGLKNEPEALKIALRNIAIYEKLGVTIAMWDDDAPDQGNNRGNYVFDHLKLLVYPDGRKVYLTEPYGVSPEGLEFLSSLAGWKVSISQFPLHFPGRCAPIELESCA